MPLFSPCFLDSGRRPSEFAILVVDYVADHDCKVDWRTDSDIPAPQMMHPRAIRRDIHDRARALALILCLRPVRMILDKPLLGSWI
jgi:hypothetical protein